MLRYVDPYRRRGRLYGTVCRLSISPAGLWLSAHVAWKLDPRLLSLTQGRLSTTGPLAAALLQTRGARSDRPRRNATLYFHDGDRVTIVASKRGWPAHPAWFYNLRAHPDVIYGGLPFRAEIVADDAERQRLWGLADRVFLRSPTTGRGRRAVRVRDRGRRAPGPAPPARRVRSVGVGTFVFRLIAPRPTFALDMTDEEREIMGRHAAYWQPYLESGQMVIFGPVLDDTGSWGLGVVEAEDEAELRAFAAGDPVVTTGTARMEVGTMPAGFVRPRGTS
jgi:deazaflavin-dependent oxidoreductase (nitroreductase family)